MSGSLESSHKKRSRRAPLVWGSGALAAAVLVLGVNGTLSAWTSAVINNDTNTTATTAAVRLTETAGVTTCNSDDTTGGTQAGGNSFTCSTINKYGGTASPLAPGQPGTSTTVSLQNTGTEDASGFTITAGACTNTTSPAIAAPQTDACDEVNLDLNCYAGTAATGTALYTYSGKLSAFSPSSADLTNAASPALAKGASETCKFTVSLPSAAPATYANQTVKQAITWTLTA